MLCKNCGKELPVAGKFCPFCGAAVEQTGVNDETAVFTTLPDDMKDPVDTSPADTGPIDTSAFDAAMRDEKQQLPAEEEAADPLADTNPNIPNPNIPTQDTMRHCAGGHYCGGFDRRRCVVLYEFAQKRRKPDSRGEVHGPRRLR